MDRIYRELLILSTSTGSTGISWIR